VPGYRSRSKQFDDFVFLALERLESDWGPQLNGIELAVENAPLVTETDIGVPLGRFIPGQADRPPRIVVYRRPLEVRAVDADDLHDLVFDVVVEQVAHYLGRRPEEIDPEYGGYN
jgi:predicted Zn-dependent protease with MMP-like domain